MALNPFDYHEPTVTELEPFLGSRWAICRNTPANRERYGRCLTPRQYADAQAAAIKARGYTRPVELVIRDLVEAIAVLQGHTGPAQHEKIKAALAGAEAMLAQVRMP